MKIIEIKLNQIILATEKCIVQFDYAWDYDKKWHGTVTFYVDPWVEPVDFNKLTVLENMANALNFIVELKKFSESIKVDFIGERSGEFFEVIISKNIMSKIKKEL